MTQGMFDGAFKALILVCVAVGIAVSVFLTGLVCLAVWLCHHVTIGWQP